MNKARPVNLNLLTIRQPITAIISILHRISGVVLFFSLPYLLWLLQGVIRSPESFLYIADCLSTQLGRLSLLLVFSAFSFHLIAGLRHILMDLGIGESKKGGRLGAIIVLLLTAILIFFGGSLIW